MLDSGHYMVKSLRTLGLKISLSRSLEKQNTFMFLGSLVGYDSSADLSGTPHAIISGEQCVLGSSVSKE